MFSVIAQNIPEKKEVTCIIPMRINKARLDALQRLDFYRLDSAIPDSIGFVVVDDGSNDYDIIKKRCAELGMGYVRIESGLREFSVGRCRNYGAMYARSKYVLMQDVDLMPWPGFYNSLIDEIKVQGLDEDAKKFLMIPFVFLTEKGTNEYLEVDESMRHRQFLHVMWLNDPFYIEKYSSGTSANLYNRLWYLSRGGNCRDFEGWGYEDLECNTRMMRHVNYFPTPKDWQLQKYNFNSVLEYRSWKAVYRLYGDMLLHKGLVFFHAWHSVDNKGTYMQRKDYNRALFEKKMKDFVVSRSEPNPLSDKSRGRTLVLKKCAFTYSRDMVPLLGDVVEPDDSLLSGGTSLDSFVNKNLIDRVVFHNPYNDQNVYRLYVEAREKNIPFVVCERGALPGSCFFDDSGFLVDSEKYDSLCWDKELSDDEKNGAVEYIKTLHNADAHLEQQAERIGASHVKKNLKIKDQEKVLLVVFQRPGDSVVKYFNDSLGGYDNFIDLVKNISYSLPPGWKMISKRHPLEDVDFELSKKNTYANDYNIKDLLDTADAVLTYNSGVGVMSMAWGLPTMLAGRAFYQNDNINTRVDSLDSVLDFLRMPKKPSGESVLRFYFHLLNELYSFGDFETKPVRMPDGSRMTATTNITFTEIRWPGMSVIKYSNNKKAVVSWDSFLFDRYRYSNQSPVPVSKNVAPGGGASANKNGLSRDNGTQAKLSRNVKETNDRGQDKQATVISKKKYEKLRNSPLRFFVESKYMIFQKIGRIISKDSN